MDKTDFSMRECEMMIDILNIRFEKFDKLTSSKIADIIKVSVTYPGYREVMKYLFNENIIIITENLGPSKLIKINRNKLEQLVLKQELLQKIFKFYESQHSIVV